MKKTFALVLTLCMLTGLLCACGDRSTQNGGTPNGGAVGSADIEELLSYVRYTSTYNSNGNIRNDETVMSFQWTDDGTTMEGYQIGDDTRADVVLEAKLDGQKRPQWIARTVTRADGGNSQSKVEFAYPNDRKIAFTRDGETWENVYDADGRLLLESHENYENGYEYDAHGNCTREWLDYKDPETTDWEESTVYTYDDSGKAVFSVTDNRNGETQTHYYYYPNGNVMFQMHISGRGDVNYQFRPYNTKDILSWSYGMVSSAGSEFEVQKDASGYIVKVIGKSGYQEGKTATFDYDQKGNLVKATGFDGRATTFEYDGQNRPVKVTKQVYENTDTTVFTYDELGRLVSEKMTNTNGSSKETTWAYNEAGMTTCREEKRVSIYTDETIMSEEKMEVQYVDNSNCSVDPVWSELYLSSLVSGIG